MSRRTCCVGKRIYTTQPCEFMPFGNANKIIHEVLKKLAAYEGTELPPEEVAELARAKAEGRLAVLPCKLGDRAYWPKPCENHIISGKVTRIEVHEHGITLHFVGTRREAQDVFFTREDVEAVMAARRPGQTRPTCTYSI